tara:strand:+ start:218 stop:337 length:120 start_codon:yes stop_codon:yes gene_type:complete
VYDNKKKDAQKIIIKKNATRASKKAKQTNDNKKPERKGN